MDESEGGWEGTRSGYGGETGKGLGGSVGELGWDWNILGCTDEFMLFFWTWIH